MASAVITEVVCGDLQLQNQLAVIDRYQLDAETGGNPVVGPPAANTIMIECETVRIVSSHGWTSVPSGMRAKRCGAGPCTGSLLGQGHPPKPVAW